MSVFADLSLDISLIIMRQISARRKIRADVIG